MRWLLPVLLFSSCYVTIHGLDPRPNIPAVERPLTSVVVVSDSVLQRTIVDDGLVLNAFRGDLKRGFLNGFPGAVKGTTGELVLHFDEVEPSRTCLAVGCTMKLRFKGVLRTDQRVLTSFAGDVKSDFCAYQKVEECYVGAIESMYQRVFELTKSDLTGPRPVTVPKANTTEL